MVKMMPVAKKTFYTKVVKRFLDILFSAIAIIVFSPLLVIVSILELIFHGYPIFFTQERPGKDGEIFRIYKFRSMTNEKDDKGNLLPGEQRLTNFGRIIRKTSIDELPELFCILTGKMSIIGPRPLLIRYLPLYSERHLHRHDVRPGLACYSLKPMKSWTWNDQFENDIWYIENCSFLIDVKMIFAVGKQAIRGSESRANDVREEFNGHNLHAGSNLE